MVGETQWPHFGGEAFEELSEPLVNFFSVNEENNGLGATIK